MSLTVKMQNACQLSVAVIIAPGMAFWQRIGTESAPTGRYMIFCLFCAVFIMLIREFLFIFAKNNQCYEKNIFPNVDSLHFNNAYATNCKCFG